MESEGVLDDSCQRERQAGYVASWGEAFRLNEQSVKFRMIRQEYSTYRMENGRILKHMPTISDICGVAGGGPTSRRVAITDVSYAISPPEMTRGDIGVSKGSPTGEDQVRELKFEVEEEVINIYETKDHIILIAGTVQKIFMTNKVDGQNSPHLLYESQTKINVVPKPHMAERQPENPDDKN